MRKVLIVHNKYRFLGGEDIAVEREINFLKKRYDIEFLFFENSIKGLFFSPRKECKSDRKSRINHLLF